MNTASECMCHVECYLQLGGDSLRDGCYCRVKAQLYGNSVIEDAATAEFQAHLFRFYGVTTKDALIEVMDRHIGKLLGRLPPLPDGRPLQPREG